MRSYSCFFRSIGEKNIAWNGPDLLVVELGLVALLSAGPPMPLVAVFGTIGFKQKNRKGLRELLLPLKSQGVLPEALKK